MPLKKHVIEKLVGVATNPVEGVAQDSPHKLIANLDRLGGYRAVEGGTTESVTGPGGTGTPSFVASGGDGWGLATTTDNYAFLFNGSTYSTGAIALNPYFVGGAGWWSGVNSYEFYDVDENILSSVDWYTSVSVTDADPAASSDLEAGSYAIFVILFAQTNAGRVWLDDGFARAATVTAGDNLEITVTFGKTAADNVLADIYVIQEDTAPTAYFAGTLAADGASDTLTLTDMPIGPTLPFGNGDGAVLMKYRHPQAVSHGRRIYGVKPETSTFTGVGFAAVLDQVSDLYASLPNNTIVYSELGYVNFAGDRNWITIASRSGSAPTALASSPAGLLVFFDTETHLIRGDPISSDFQVQLFSGSFGADGWSGVARLGGVVFVIHEGELYSLSLGMGDVDFGQGAQKISDPVFDPEDHFEFVAPDYRRKHIVVGTASGVIKRFDADSGQWLTDPLSGNSLNWLVPNPDADGVRYVLDDAELDDVRTLTGGLQTIEVDFDALDCGDKNLMKLWRRVEVFTDADYAGAPTLTYTVRGASAMVSGVDQGDGRWVFTFGRGVVGPTADLEFTFPNPTSSTTVEPPLVIEYAPRYRER